MIATRLEVLPRAWVRAILIGFALLLVVAARTSLPPVHTEQQKANMAAFEAKHGRPISDDDLYHEIRVLVAKGEGYYQAAAKVHRAHGYPLVPFMTVRLPTLAVLSATLGLIGTWVLFVALSLATAAIWFVRAKREIGHEMAAILITAAAVMSGSVYALRDVPVLHEAWGALLIALSLGLWRPGRWGVSVGLGLLAALFREHANIYLLTMAGVALLARDWRETAGWIGAIVVSAACIGLHARGVASIVEPGDFVSPGWQTFGGLALFILGIVETTALVSLPRWLAGPLAVVSLAGWAMWRSPLALRALAFYAAFALAVMLFARRDNFYWSWLVSPLVLSGIVLFVTALPRALARAGLNLRPYLPGSTATSRTTTSM